MLKVGGAVSNWKDNTEEYQKIQGVLLDVKTLMSINVRQEMKEIEKDVLKHLSAKQKETLLTMVKAIRKGELN